MKIQKPAMKNSDAVKKPVVCDPPVGGGALNTMRMHHDPELAWEGGHIHRSRAGEPQPPAPITHRARAHEHDRGGCLAMIGNTGSNGCAGVLEACMGQIWEQTVSALPHCARRRASQLSCVHVATTAHTTCQLLRHMVSTTSASVMPSPHELVFHDTTR